MNTEITNALKATSDTAQYDNSAKRLLGNKYILAQILVYTVDEFKGDAAAGCSSFDRGRTKDRNLRLIQRSLRKGRFLIAVSFSDQIRNTNKLVIAIF